MQTILGYVSLILNLISPGIILVGFLSIGLILRGHPRVMLLALIGYCGAIAFMFIPTEYDDLYRYQYLIDRFRRYGWTGIKALYIDNYWYATSLMFQGLMYGLSFLPEWCTVVLTSGTTYVLIGLFDFRYFKYKDTSNRMQCLVILLQFVAIDLYSTLSSWLYMLTLAVIANVLFTDLVLKKRRIVCLMAYIVLGQLHTVAYIIFLFRLFAMLLSTKMRRITLVIVAFWRLFVDAVLKIAAGFTNTIFGKRIYENLLNYSGYVENSNLVYMIGLSLFAVVCIVCIEKNNKQNAESFKDIGYIVECCCALILGAWGSQNLMFRFAHFTMMLMPLHIGEEMRRCGDRLSIRNLSLPLFMTLVSVALLLVYYVWISYRLLI